MKRNRPVLMVQATLKGQVQPQQEALLRQAVFQAILTTLLSGNWQRTAATRGIVTTVCEDATVCKDFSELRVHLPQRYTVFGKTGEAIFASVCT